jgi:hypothetical protein
MVRREAPVTEQLREEVERALAEELGMSADLVERLETGVLWNALIRRELALREADGLAEAANELDDLMDDGDDPLYDTIEAYTVREVLSRYRAAREKK